MPSKIIADIIIILIVLSITVGIIIYLRKQKKQGAKCIGCPYAKECSGHCTGCDTSASSQKQ